MKKRLTSEKILLDEISQLGHSLIKLSRHLTIGERFKLIRKQLGMSQKVLAKRAGVPQSSISRVERNQTDFSVSTLQKITSALSCNLLLLPVLHDSIDTIRQNRARLVATRHVNYLKGTMGLEMQEPDERFIKELIKEEETELLSTSSPKLWED